MVKWLRTLLGYDKASYPRVLVKNNTCHTQKLCPSFVTLTLILLMWSLG